MAISPCPLARSVATPSQSSESRCDPWQTHALLDGSCRDVLVDGLTQLVPEQGPDGIYGRSRSYFLQDLLVYSVQCSLDPVPARSLVGRHNSWLLLCSFSAQRYLGGLWSENSGNISILLTAVGLLVTSRSRVLPISCVAPFTTFSSPLSLNISRHLSCSIAPGWPDT